MTVLLTTAGAAHIVELDAPSALTYAFDGITFGAGNDTPAIDDAYGPSPADFTQELGSFFQAQSGYPKLNDTDARNTGAASTTWTWKYIIPAGTPFVASNILGLSYAGGVPADSDPALFSGKQTIAQRYDERLIVWVNVPAGAAAGSEPTVITAIESALENRVQRVVGFVASNRAIGGHPAGSVVDHTAVKTRPQAGQYVWTAADIVGVAAGALLVGDVNSLKVEVQRWSGSEHAWKLDRLIPLDRAAHVTEAHVYSDQRWTAQGGFNVSHTWTPPLGAREGTWRLLYTMSLSDGDVRAWTNIVEVRDGRA